MRGEHWRYSWLRSSSRGSTPHARRALALHRLLSLRHGIIPSSAGSTRAHERRAQLHRNHPRIRREHRMSKHTRWLSRGSSPHTRGARSVSDASVRLDGIIPAYAGSTCGRPSAPSCRRDHPRIRGEHQTFTEKSTFNQGSSPHTRGAPGGQAGDGQEHGIIPAYAGSTRSPFLSKIPARDHPRIRGEHTLWNSASPAAMGSSPHTRGAHGLEVGKSEVEGIIPAYAGSTVIYLQAYQISSSNLFTFFDRYEDSAAVSADETYAPCGASTRCSIPSEANP